MLHTGSIDIAVLDAAKWTFTTRRVRREDARHLCSRLAEAQAGDLVLCEVLSIGQHKQVQLADRRLSQLYPGDLIVLALGDRYAPDQFHATATLDAKSVHLVAGGGIVGRVDAAHGAMKEPTLVRPLGRIVGARNEAVNVAAYALPSQLMDHRPTVIGVFGASMNSGKTTAAASLAHGLRRSGHATAAIKATGTGAFADYHAFEDAGVAALDFTDVGMATTYRMPMARIEEGFATLIATCAAAGADVIVCEIADGVFQHETRAVLRGSSIRDRLDGILFAAPDALSAYGAVRMLDGLGLSPFAISGLVSISPLALAEAAEVTGLPVLTRDDLRSPERIGGLVAPLMRSDLSKSAA
jgi:hypothetical protein